MNRINYIRLRRGEPRSANQYNQHKQTSLRLPTRSEAQLKINRRVKPIAGWIATCLLLFSPCVPAHAGWLKPDVDYSNYDVPLYDQIVNRIKAKVSARLGEGKNERDRYFIIPFAYQDRWHNPQFSHSFIAVIRVLAEGKQPRAISRFRPGSFLGRFTTIYSADSAGGLEF